MEKSIVQIIKPVDASDKKVIEARRIAESVKVLPYSEVEKLLDKRASDFSLARAQGQ